MLRAGTKQPGPAQVLPSLGRWHSSMQVIRLSLECCSDVQRSTCLVSHSFPSVTVFQDQLCDPFEHGVLRFAPRLSAAPVVEKRIMNLQKRSTMNLQKRSSMSPSLRTAVPGGIPRTAKMKKNYLKHLKCEVRPVSLTSRRCAAVVPPASRCHNAGFHWPNTRAPCFHEVLLSGFSLPRPRTAFALVVSLTEPLSSIVY